MFKKALEITRDHIPSIFHLGIMQHRNGNLTEALVSFSNVLDAFGDDRIVYESRGLVYQENKNNEGAIDDFNKAIELDPEYAETYYYRGLSRIE
jgi:tetratricopeptide (TPR) repeat protein